MKRMLMFLAACVASAPMVAAAQSGVVVRPTQLVAAPFVDADSHGTMARETPVEIIARDGGWYHVRADDGREGWVRLSSIRLGEVATEDEGGFWSSLFAFTGRAQTRTASATTGIRGLDEAEIRNAAPDAAAVDRLATFAATAAATRRFAAEIGLQSREVKTLADTEEGAK